MTDTEKVALIATVIKEFWDYNDEKHMENGAMAMVTAISSIVDFKGKEE